MIVIWIAAIVVFGIVEAVTVGLVSIWFVLGAVAGLLAAVLGAALWVQIVLFFVVSIAALAATRPLVQRMLRRDETPTNADRVLLTALHDRLLADPKLAKLARSSDPQIFTESIFPKAFDTAAQDSYLEAQDTFSSLFEDTSKYKAIMSALAEWLYGEFRKK